MLSYQLDSSTTNQDDITRLLTQECIIILAFALDECMCHKHQNVFHFKRSQFLLTPPRLCGLLLFRIQFRRTLGNLRVLSIK